MRARLSLSKRRQQPGQALVLVAVLLPVVIMLLFAGIELSARAYQRARVEAAVQDAARAAAQRFSYERFAGNDQALSDPVEVALLGQTVLATNLTGVRGLLETPSETAARAEWQVLPEGGTCTILADPLTFDMPAVCARLEPPLHGITGFGTWAPRVEAAATSDLITTP